jgi:orotidine-5'-phosphate decarboxylase
VAELIVAFDVPTARQALELADSLDHLRWAKIGSVLFVREGPAVVREFQKRRVNVFLDLKWHDIPNTVGEAVAAARDLGVALATVHCLGGRAMLEAAVRRAGDMRLVGITILTSHTAVALSQILGRGIPDVGFEVERLAKLALEAGLSGVVASGHELGILRETLGPKPLIVVPGIRPQGSDAEQPDDQARTITAGEAVRRGATHLVVGRPITAAPDPGRIYRQLIEAL